MQSKSHLAKHIRGLILWRCSGPLVGSLFLFALCCLLFSPCASDCGISDERREESKVDYVCERKREDSFRSVKRSPGACHDRRHTWWTGSERRSRRRRRRRSRRRLQSSQKEENICVQQIRPRDKVERDWSVREGECHSPASERFHRPSSTAVTLF